MLIVVILVCSINVTPSLMDCDRTNAVRVIPVPGHYRTLRMCVAHGEAYMNMLEAEGTVTPRDDERVLAKCLLDPDGDPL
jgi:hypothetical protein